MEQNKNTQPNAGRSDNDLEVTIHTTQGDWTTTFDKNTKVDAVIKAAVDHFHFASPGNYQLSIGTEPVKVLEPQRPLVSYGIKDGDEIDFTDLGDAV